jgi:hypothetical protein
MVPAPFAAWAKGTFSHRGGVFMRKVLFLVALVMGLTVAGPAWAAPDDLPTHLPTATPQTFTVDLKPSGDPDGSGTAELTLNLGAQTVCYDITVNGIGVPTEPAAGIGNAHIHSHTGGGIAVDLETQFSAVEGAGDTYQASDCVTAPRGVLLDILLNPEQYYVNVHTVDNPTGAVQGDLA